MKKKIIILLLILILLLGAGVIYLALNLNSLISKFKPDLEKIASDTLGMPVNFGNLEASIFPETQIIIKELKLGGGNNTQAFKLGGLALNIKLMSLIASQKLEITKLTINSPEITVSKTPEGMDISGVPKKAAGAKAQDNTPKDAAAQPVKAPIAVSLNSLEVENAKLSLLNFVKDKELTISDIDISSAIALEGSLVNVNKLSLDALLLGKTKVSLSADSIVLDNGSSELKIPAMKVNFNGDVINLNATYNIKTTSAVSAVTSDKIDVEKLIAAFPEFIPPAVKEFNLKGSVKPALNIKTSGSKYNADGTVGLLKFSADVKQFKVTELLGQIQLTADNIKQTVKIPELGLNLNGNPVKITADTSLTFPEFDVTSLLVKAFAGELHTTGKLIIGTPVTFNLQNQISNMQVESALNALKPGPALLKGTLDKANANLSGKLDASFMQALSGNVYYSLSNGELVGFNIGSKVLKAVNNLSFLSGSLYERAQNKKGLFDVADTVFKVCTANIAIGGGGMNTRDLFLSSTAYDLNASGRINFDMSLDLKSHILFTPDVSEQLIGSIKELKSALDENKRLVIPLAIQGTPPAIIVIPDMQKVIEMATKSFIKEKATDLLEGALRRKTGGGSASGLGNLLGF